MALNEDAVVELLGELVFTHTFRTFDAKERAHKLVKELRGEDAKEETADPEQPPA